jgi:hypothetical protein
MLSRKLVGIRAADGNGQEYDNRAATNDGGC